MEDPGVALGVAGVQASEEPYPAMIPAIRAQARRKGVRQGLGRDRAGAQALLCAAVPEPVLHLAVDDRAEVEQGEELVLILGAHRGGAHPFVYDRCRATDSVDRGELPRRREPAREEVAASFEVRGVSPPPLHPRVLSEPRHEDLMVDDAVEQRIVELVFGAGCVGHRG